MRITLAVAVACLTLGGLAAAGDATAAIRKQTDIPSEGLAPALNALAKDRNFQIVYVTEEIVNVRTEGAVGEFTTEEALKKLLTGTGLTYRYLDDKTVTVGSAKAPSERSGSASKITSSGTSDDANANQEGKKSSSSGFRVAQVDQGKGSSPVSVGNQLSNSQESSGTSSGLAEIIVTAQKREERLFDVPMSITAISGEQLQQSQSYRFEDYVGNIPGLTYMTGFFGPGGSQLVIRGLTSGAGANNTVASYIDETPYGQGQGGYSAPDLDTFDMQRVEVLRGPQGTLYGAGALGGLIKYVTNAPDPSGFSAEVETGISSIYNGGAGFDVHGMVNLPLSTNAAVRLVGYDNYYPGFIDDPSRGVTDINGSHFAGGRASLLYLPRSDFSVRLSALYQNRTWGDANNVYVNPNTFTPVYGTLNTRNLVSQPGYTKNELYSATINWDAGFAKLLSTTSYARLRLYLNLDYSPVLGDIVSSIFNTPYGVAYQHFAPEDTWTQEVRLSSASEGRLQWSVGAYYADDYVNTFPIAGSETLYPIDPGTHKILYSFSPNLGSFPTLEKYRELAEFVSLDLKLTSTFDVEVGGRYSTNHQDSYADSEGIFGGGIKGSGNVGSQNAFTYSTAARWHVSQDNLVYARVASGFTPGFPLIHYALTPPDVPYSVGPAKTVNYEVGIKSDLLDHRLSVDMSAFDVEWTGIPISTIIAGFTTTVAGGKARSSGAEGDLAYTPIGGLTLSLNGAYTDAYLTKAEPGLANDGARLPSVPLWEASAGARYERGLFGDYKGLVGVNWRFSGDRYAEFESIGPRQLMPSFNMVDFRVGVETKKWSLILFVKNVANKIAINYVKDWTAASGGNGLQEASIYPPRSIGAELTARF